MVLLRSLPLPPGPPPPPVPAAPPRPAGPPRRVEAAAVGSASATFPTGPSFGKVSLQHVENEADAAPRHGDAPAGALTTGAARAAADGVPGPTAIPCDASHSTVSAGPADA